MAKSKTTEPAAVEMLDVVEAGAVEVDATEPAAVEPTGLDLGKPFATVHGSNNGAAYQQDGVFYDRSGAVVDQA